LNQIIGFDETSFYMDAPGSYTIEKTRLSCLMTATASGKKLPIVCVVPRKKRINGIDLPENALVVYDTNGNLSQIFKL
jgi:type II secretory pathway component PulK